MKRFGSIIGIHADKLEAYKHLHANTWPEVLEILQASNIRNYSIYHKDGLLFSYYEYIGTDYAKDMAQMATYPTIQDWWTICNPCQKPLDSRAEGEWWSEMEEVFHMD